ncbi:uncharacterized protein N7483_001593 [Penicillium malachiteum]|uniref:uncharacterized protein n=1 Tax=Penicillium malachiteum TaxID=1324776 RepID=UPI002549387A|nr:uncharacterized protein N7483_001593 [Penicillium malachiteum]KAJ5736468.1 hypothetical protein N7483_001593 [Penicillium malachiteum]
MKFVALSSAVGFVDVSDISRLPFEPLEAFQLFLRSIKIHNPSVIIRIAPTAAPTPIPVFAPVESPEDFMCDSDEEVADVAICEVVVVAAVWDVKSPDRHRIETPLALIPSAEVVKLLKVEPLVNVHTDEVVTREVHLLVVNQSRSLLVCTL